MKFVLRETRRNPEKNVPRLRFVHQTHLECPRRELGITAVGGERVTACAKESRSDLCAFQTLQIESLQHFNLIQLVH